MKRVPVGVLCLGLLLAACGGGSDSATTTTAEPETSTTAEATTTTTVDLTAEVSELAPFTATAGEFLDLVSGGIPLYLEAAETNAVPANDEGGAIGGEVAPGVSVYALAADLGDQVRGSVVLVNVEETGGTTPAQFVATAVGSLNIADVTAVSAFDDQVVPALSTIDENVQRFALGGTTLELRVYAPQTLAFVFVSVGEQVPAVVDGLV